MSTIAELMVRIGADTSGAESGFSRIASGAGNIVGSIAKIGIAGAAAIGGALVAATTAGIQGIIAMEDQTAQLEAVLKSTGGAVGLTKDQLIETASAYQLNTKFAEEDVLAAENLLLTFTNIGGDVFPMATQSLLDMATAMGGDASSNAIQLGKALNDPTAGISALTRVGVTFSEEQQKMITKLQETGDMAGAQKIILAELTKEFGGSAEAAGKTFSGQLEITKNALGELTENMAMGVMPALTAMMSAVNEAANSGDWSNVGSVIGDGLDDIISNLMDGFTAALPTIQTVGLSVLTSIVDGLISNKDALIAGVSGIIDTLTKFLIEAGPDLIVMGFDLLMALIEGIITNLPALVDAAMATIGKLAESLVAALPTLIPAIIETVLAIVDGLIANIGILVDAAIEIVIALALGIIDALPLLIEKAPEIITKLVEALIENLPKLVEAAFQIIVMLAKGIIENLPALGEACGEIITTLATGLDSLIGRLLEVGRNIVEGIWQGIQDSATWVADKITGFFSGIIDGVKNILGIHSPSTVFAGIGKYMSEGLGVGIVSGKQFVTDAISGVIKDAVDQMSTASEILTTKFDLWTSTIGATASESAKLQKQLEMENEQMKLVSAQVDIMEAAYAKMKASKGEAALESQKLYLALLKELQVQADLQSQINTTTAAVSSTATSTSSVRRGFASQETATGTAYYALTEDGARYISPEEIASMTAAVAARNPGYDQGVIFDMVKSNIISGVEQYATGTPYVPNDGLAYLHKGEAVITAEENSNSSGTQNITVYVQADDLRQAADVIELFNSLKQTSRQGAY